MDASKRWREIDRLFAEALDRAPEKRWAFLENACADDGVRKAVEDLLAAVHTDSPLDQPLEERSGAFWQDFAAELPREDAARSGVSPSMAGQRAGPYRLVREIGRGGMGVVYLAERADGHFEQQVAVKVLRREPFMGDLARRFAQERQILASLQHPNIARLYDGGVTKDGLPYLVMEHIEGQPIDVCCEHHSYTFDERLELLLSAVRAVQHAHQRLIIHRDLKPSNLLVTPEGEPKLLDFGLAKLLEESGEGRPAALPTRRWMTLQYASPEQVRGEALTTASDTYQLGLILYELLTGQRPYSVEGKMPSEAERVICETEPARPSTTVTAAAADAPAAFASPRQLRMKLRGDLDTIICKALRKDPARGYASAEALADDLERHLEGRPISARPDTLGYRAGKFVQRHRVGVAATALVVLSLLAGLAGTIWQARRAADEARRATAERDKAEQVTVFLIDVFEVAEPSAARGDTVTARELLARGAARIRSDLSEQPEEQTAMMTALGRVYRQLGLYDEARPLLEDALDARRTHLDAPHPDIAESLHELGVLLYQQSEYDRAEALLQEALDVRRTIFEAPHAALASSLNRLGLIAAARQEYERAEALYREALAMRRALHGDTHRRVAQTKFYLASVLHDQADYGGAGTFFEKAVATYRRLPDDPTPEYASSLQALATIHSARSNYAAAESLHQEALDVRRRLYSPRHPEVATSLGYLGGVLHRRGNLDTAEARYREAISIYRDAYDGDADKLAWSLANFGAVLADQGRFDEAEARYREALAMNRRIYGADHLNVALDLQELAGLLQERREGQEAERLYRRALAIYRKTYGAEHPMTAGGQVDLGVLMRERGDLKPAVSTLREALASYRKTLRPGHERIAEVQLELGTCLTAAGDYEKAEQHLLKSYEISRRLDHDEKGRRAALERLAALYEAWGRPEEAQRYASLQAK